MNRMSGRKCFSAMINRYFYLKRGKEYDLVLETEKSRERAIAEILMIDEVVSSRV